MHGGHYTAYVRVRKQATKPVCAVAMVNGGNNTGAQSATQDSISAPSNTTGASGVRTSQASCVGAAQPPCATRPEHNDETGVSVGQTTQEFDLSSGDGQWYYMSDSHVRTATESEVMKSQAYILFYERVPLIQRGIVS